MIDHGKRVLLGVRVDAVDYQAAEKRILDAARGRMRCTCAALAVHGVMSGALDPVHRYRLNHLDLVVPDGQPVRWGLNWLYGLRLKERVYGPQLTLRVCRAAADGGLAVYLYGSRPEVLADLRGNLQRRFPALRIVGAEPSRFRRLSGEEEKEALVRRIRASGAAIVLVGLGCPRQEVFAYELGDALGLPLLAVGAAFDFHAGSLPQAPSWMQGAGLEWLYRLCREPRRLWRRYLLLNPAYVVLLVGQKLGVKRLPASDLPAPETELLYG